MIQGSRTLKELKDKTVKNCSETVRRSRNPCFEGLLPCKLADARAW